MIGPTKTAIQHPSVATSRMGVTRKQPTQQQTTNNKCTQTHTADFDLPSSRLARPASIELHTHGCSSPTYTVAFHVGPVDHFHQTDSEEVFGTRREGGQQMHGRCVVRRTVSLRLA